MPRLRLLVSAVSMALLLVAGFPSLASAYIDPGNGSYLFQILLGVFLTAAVTFRSVWTKVVSFFKSLLNRPSSR